MNWTEKKQLTTACTANTAKRLYGQREWRDHALGEIDNSEKLKVLAVPAVFAVVKQYL